MCINLSFSNIARRLTPDAVQMFIVNRKLKKRLEYWADGDEFSDIRSLDDKVLTELIGTEWARAKELDEKLNKLTASLSVAVTVGGVVSKTIFDGLAASGSKTVVSVIMFISMGLFLFGAVIGFSGLRPKPRFGYGAGFLSVIAKGGAEARNELIEAACGFQNMNIVRSNEASTAIGLIRNGIILFTVAIAFSFFAPTSNQCVTATPPTSSLEKEAAPPKAQIMPSLVSIISEIKTFMEGHSNAARGRDQNATTSTEVNSEPPKQPEKGPVAVTPP